MSKEQIEEMETDIGEKQEGGWRFVGKSEYTTDVFNKELAEHLVVNKGYRKQSEGEWIWTENGTEDYEQYWLCSCCNNKSYWKSKFCEECGAKMKGESE